MKEQKMQIIITKEEVESRIRQIASQLNEKYKDEKLYLIGTLKGSIFFCVNLLSSLQCQLSLILYRFLVMGKKK